MDGNDDEDEARGDAEGVAAFVWSLAAATLMNDEEADDEEGICCCGDDGVGRGVEERIRDRRCGQAYSAVHSLYVVLQQEGSQSQRESRHRVTPPPPPLLSIFSFGRQRRLGNGVGSRSEPKANNARNHRLEIDSVARTTTRLTLNATERKRDRGRESFSQSRVGEGLVDCQTEST